MAVPAYWKGQDFVFGIVLSYLKIFASCSQDHFMSLDVLPLGCQGDVQQALSGEQAGQLLHHLLGVLGPLEQHCS